MEVGAGGGIPRRNVGRGWSDAARHPQGTFVRSFALAAPFEGGGSSTRILALRNGTLVIEHVQVVALDAA